MAIYLKFFPRLFALLGFALVWSSCGDRETLREEAPAAESAQTASDPVYAGKLALSPRELYKKVKAGTKEVDFVFTARNEGDAPIRITRIDSGCDCIEESVSQALLAPGETATIKAVYDTEKINGLAEKTLGLLTDQPDVPEVFLIVRLETEPLYRFPTSLTFTAGKPEIRVIPFEVLRDEPIHILSVTSSRSQIMAEVRTVEEGRKYEIQITPETSAKMLGMIRIATDCEIEAHASPLIYVIVQ